MRNPEDEWASVAQAAEALGVSKVNVYDKVARGLVPVATVGKTTLVARSWLELAAASGNGRGHPDWGVAMRRFREGGDPAA